MTGCNADAQRVASYPRRFNLALPSACHTRERESGIPHQVRNDGLWFLPQAMQTSPSLQLVHAAYTLLARSLYSRNTRVTT
jgi:hypothetical protein